MKRKLWGVAKDRGDADPNCSHSPPCSFSWVFSMKPTSKLFQYALWALLSAEVIFLLLPRTILDLRVLHFFISTNDQPAFDGQVLGMGILLVMMAVELFGLFTLWWLALRCTKNTIKEIPAYIWIGAAFSVVWMLNFVLPILWALVAIPLFTTPKQCGLLQAASLIVTTTAFTIMYWRGRQHLHNGRSPDASQVAEATYNDKNKVKWQRGLIAVAVVAMAGYVFMQPASKPYLTLEEASKLHYPVSIKGAPFDIPITHTRTGGSIIKGGGYFNTWESPTQGEIEGTERKEVDYIKIGALLPDMTPYTEQTAAEFDKLGWGKVVVISLSHRPWGSWDNFLSNSIKQNSPLEQIQNSTKVSGLLHYIDAPANREYFVSQDHLRVIRCVAEPKQQGRFPYCELNRPYKYKAGSFVPNNLFIEYTFSRDYLQQWREIDEKVDAIFDRFAASAQQH